MTNQSGKDSWEDHRRRAAGKFLLNAVIIDNEPTVRSPSVETPSGPPAGGTDEQITIEDPKDFGSGKEEETLPEPKKGETPPPDANAQDDASQMVGIELNVQRAGDAFADEGILCSFLLPDDRRQDEETIKKRALKLATPSDLVIIDWYLKDHSASLTLKILHELVQADCDENGRLRLVCIYTSQPQIDDIITKCGEELKKTDLKNRGLILGKEKITADNFRLIAFKKEEVDVEALPKKLVEAFAPFADGLLPAFALTAVGAVRRNTHHIVTQFSKDLDAAYVANRLITDPPGDMAELMRELFASECDAALGLDRVADACLENEAIGLWLDERKHPIRPDSHFKIESEKVPVDRAFLEALLNGKLDTDTNKVNLGDEAKVAFKEDKRKVVSQSLHGKAGEEKQTERKFARFVALKREAFGSSKWDSSSGWKPSLTLGTLLKKVEAGPDQYLYCLTPACDTVRLQGKKRAFLFLIMTVDNKKPSLIVISPEGKELTLRADFKPANIEKYRFQGDAKLGRVLAERNGVHENSGFFFTSAESDEVHETSVFAFTSAEEERFLWLGEVRTSRAQRDLSEFTKQWMRFGIIDSEYLRLAGKGLAPL